MKEEYDEKKDREITDIEEIRDIIENVKYADLPCRTRRLVSGAVKFWL